MATKLVRHALTLTTDETTLIHAAIKYIIAAQGDDEDFKSKSLDNLLRIAPSTHALDRLRRRVSRIIHGDIEAGYGRGLDIEVDEMAA